MRMNIVVDDLLTTYQRQGTGKTVVFLHGWGDNSATFQSLQTALGADFDTISFDLPGFGQTQMPTGVWGLDDYAQFVGHALDKLGTRPYVIIAHSNGGAIAIRGLKNGILNIDKLVLLSSSGIRGEYNSRKKALRLAAKTGKVLTFPLPGTVKKRLRKHAYQRIGSDMFVAEHLQETFKKVVTDDILADAQNITVPTLIVYGKDDTATPPRYGELLHKAIKNSQLVILPSAGHFVHHDQPNEVQRLVREFLDG